MKFRLVLLSFMLLNAFSGRAQLADFILNVNPTNETCNGNGKVAYSVTGITAGSTMRYSLYLLPNTTTPIFETNANSIPGLNSGNYKLLAKQTLGDMANFKEELFTISDETTPKIIFTITPSTTNSCDSHGSMLTITITQGVGPFFYEILQGPATFPPQTSNQFSGLAGGFYKIRVIGNCGDGTTQDYTLLPTSNNLSISAAAVAPIATSCSNMHVVNTVTPSTGSAIIYPLNVKYIIHPATGPDQIIMQDFATGPPDALELDMDFPVANDIYHYDIIVTDSCPNFFNGLDNEIDPNPHVFLTGTPNTCGQQYLTIGVSNFLPPFIINSFTLVPTNAGDVFNPADFNSLYPGPLTTPTIDFGDLTHTVPEGTYEVSITDSCGRPALGHYLVEVEKKTPKKDGFEANCTTHLGGLRVQIPDRKIVSAFITAAPAMYAQPLPTDVSGPSFISTNTGVLSVFGLPIGIYKVTVTDECNVTYIDLEIEIKDFVNNGIGATSNPSCSPGKGSIRVRSLNNTPLTNLIITAAPAEFGTSFPMDVTSQLVGGELILSDLPAGIYSFTGNDMCGTNSTDVQVIGYNPGVNNFVFQRNCGSFNLRVTDTANILGDYWFQRFNPTANVWENPETGADYIADSLPDEINSIKLTNNSTVFNLTYTGDFRIIKTFKSFSQQVIPCKSELGSFAFSGQLEVTGAYTLDCEGGTGPQDVFINVLGVPPYQFSIEEKDGLPFFVSNGNSNTFSGLEPALYKIRVEDQCAVPRIAFINVAALLPLVKATEPDPADGPRQILVCSDNGAQTAEFDLTTFNADILGNQAPGNYKISYYESLQQAEAGTAGALPDLYTNTTNPQRIYVRLEHATIGICHDTTFFDLRVGQTPVLSLLPPVFVCNGGSVPISADPGFSAYLWSTGDTTPSIVVTQPGVYTVDVKNVYGKDACIATQSVTVNPSSIATITDIQIDDWTDNENSITVTVDGNSGGDYEYSLDNSVFQSSNVFDHLIPGVYTVYVNDINGCGTAHKEVLLLNYPKYFTPNNDGYNDKWQIKYSVLEPSMYVYIYDRFGKLITGFDARSPGWDGTYNGYDLPSTDYWFVVNRADGRILKGHFAMKR